MKHYYYVCPGTALKHRSGAPVVVISEKTKVDGPRCPDCGRIMEYKGPVPEKDVRKIADNFQNSRCYNMGYRIEEEDGLTDYHYVMGGGTVVEEKTEIRHSTYTEELTLFSELGKHCLTKLAANRHKAHWETVDIEILISYLDKEVAELKQAVRAHQPPALVWREAADVANFAAMVAAVQSIPLEKDKEKGVDNE